MNRMLIKNASIVTVDDTLGDLPHGDILIEDETIVAVAPNLAAADAVVVNASGMIAIPGLVNSHIHTWEIALRGIGADWVSARDYFGTLHGNLTHRFEADDNRIVNLIGALAQLDGGTTTIFDWCHNLRHPEMSDAAIDGLEASGIRAVFGHGTAKPMFENKHADKAVKSYTEIGQPRTEVHRLRSGRLASDTRKVTMALAILGPDWSTYDVTEADMRLAREYGLIHSAHTYGRTGKRVTPDGMWRLQKAGLLGPDHNVVHGNCLGDDELRMIVEAGCSISATCTAEMLNCEYPALLGRVERFGGVPAIGTDVDPYFNASMLAEMRRCFFHQRELDNVAAARAGRHPPAAHATTTRSALRWATMGGAQALRMEGRIGSITPGKQADIVLVRADDLNLFAALPGGDPVHTVVMNAETANIEAVMVAGEFVKRHGRLVFDGMRLQQLKTELLGVRERVMAAGAYAYAPRAAGERIFGT
ncbi:MAG: amidohydrolase family protein [Proteobacteria bacterium]|nr:amidohydrolase family protein [Burkholderiales bacterium]